MVLPLISICVPLYNKAAYLERTLPALLGQTYPNLEIVLSDNASDDGSTEIAVECALQNSGRVHYYRLHATLSQNESWRYALKLAHGDFVNLHSADDWSLPLDFVEKMVAPLLEKPEVDFSVCDTHIVPAPGFDERAAAVMVNVHRTIAEHAQDLLATSGRYERARKLLVQSLENRVGSPYTALCRREALPWAHWQKAAHYWPESYADWGFMLLLHLSHQGVWVSDTHLDYHLDAAGGYWQVVSGQDKRLALFDKMYRLLMPVTLLTDPELADLRRVATVQELQELRGLVQHRLLEAEVALELRLRQEQREESPCTFTP